MPSIEMAISAFFNTAVKSMDVNWDPLVRVDDVRLVVAGERFFNRFQEPL